jgi:hypothetical protein
VVNTLTTATQRANSKSSQGSSNNFVQKLVGQSKVSANAPHTNLTNLGTPSGMSAGTFTNVFKSNNYLQSFQNVTVDMQEGVKDLEKRKESVNSHSSQANISGLIQNLALQQPKVITSTYKPAAVPGG